MAREARGWKKQRWRRAGIRVGTDVASRSQRLKFGEGTLQGEMKWELRRELRREDSARSRGKEESGAGFSSSVCRIG